MNKTRLLIIYFCFIFLFFILILRMLFISLNGDKVKNKTLYNPEQLLPRANIVDRNGIILATDIKTKSLYINLALIKDHKLLSKKISKILVNVNEKVIYKKLHPNKNGWILIQHNITPKLQESLQNLEIAGILFQDNLSRVYPYKSSLSHIIGYTDYDRNGLSGMEKQYDKILKKNKDALELSIDIRVQHILENELKKGLKKYKAFSATGIVMDVNNGEVIAISTIPDFDLNKQSKASNEKKFNRATYGVYELGSIFKIFTNALVFDRDLIKINDKFNVKEPIKWGNFTIKDDHYVKDEMTVEEIFKYSSNIGTLKIFDKITPEVQKDFLKSLGLLDKIDTDFLSLGTPIYPKRWRQIHSMTISYGHGIAVTPLHIAISISSIINGGNLYKPSFTKIKNKSTSVKVIKESTSKIIRTLMRKTVEEGTGRYANLAGYKIGGKTGTALIAEKGGYSENKTRASFVAIFPSDNPRYLTLIIYNRPSGRFTSGGTTSAITTKNIIKLIAPILNISP